MDPKFYTKAGKLTPYAFYCGYVEHYQDLTLGREHGVYYVTGFGRGERHVYESYRTLTAARKAIKALGR